MTTVFRRLNALLARLRHRTAARRSDLAILFRRAHRDAGPAMTDDPFWGLARANAPAAGGWPRQPGLR